MNDISRQPTDETDTDIKDVEEAWRANLVKYTPAEWLAIFPEAREFIIPKLRELEFQMRTLEEEIPKALHGAKKFEDYWFIREVIGAFQVTDLIQLKKEYYRLKRYLPQIKPMNQISQEQIERARAYPILELAEAHMGELKRSGRTYRALCPYHDERSPSFYLYPGTNTFHCFGCQKNGDVISLTQHLLSMNFVEAVEHLTI